jgi:hypothetical protein
MAFVQVAPKQIRQAGQIGPTVWQAVPVGSVSVELRALMNNPDLRDTSLEIFYQVDGSNDGGVTDYLVGRANWQGGVPNRDGTFSPPALKIVATPMPTHWRVSAVIPRELNIGLEVEVL